jgi:hypothetical protein
MAARRLDATHGATSPRVKEIEAQIDTLDRRCSGRAAVHLLAPVSAIDGRADRGSVNRLRATRRIARGELDAHVVRLSMNWQAGRRLQSHGARS